MKLGTVFATLSAATLVLAQPASAATRSADSLPSASAKVTALDARQGSTLRTSESAVGTPMFLWVVGIIGFAAAMALVLSSGDDNFNTDGLPASPG